MRPPRSRFHDLYGAPARHLVVMVLSFALAVYVVAVLGADALWSSVVWWQSILVWFIGAVVLHDLVLFPLVALADRLLGRRLPDEPAGSSEPRTWRDVPIRNHVRVPVLAVALLFALFWPGIVQQGSSSYAAATGQTQDPFLERWLLLSAAILTASAAMYAVRVLRVRRSRSESPDDHGR